MLKCAAEESCTHAVSDVQFTVSVYKLPYNLSVIVEHRYVERRIVLLF